MTIGIVILCRYSSSRLPGKILLPVANTPILTHIVERVRRSGLPAVVATSDQVGDDPIEKHCRQMGVTCFRGSLENVAERFLRAAQAQGWQYATRVNGDNLFVDPALLRDMVEIAVTGAYDLVTNVPGRTYPPGTSIEIIDVGAYMRLYQRFVEPQHFEHVTLYLYDNPGCCRQYIHANPDKAAMSGVNLAVDTQADYLQAQRIMSLLPAPLIERSLLEITKVAKNL